MLQPIPLHGLYHRIARSRASATAAARRARNPKTDARDAYEAGETARKDELKAAAMQEHAESNCKVIEGVEQLVAYLGNSAIDSEYRSLAMIALEEASMWLRREIGDPEPERNFKTT